MMSVNASSVSGADAIKLVQQGQQLLCPVCAAVLKTVPENWEQGKALHGIECPNNQQHFVIHCEDEHAMKNIRARMRARAK